MSDQGCNLKGIDVLCTWVALGEAAVLEEKRASKKKARKERRKGMQKNESKYTVTWGEFSQGRR